MSSAQPSSELERELAIEQAHVDLVVKHLAKATRSARSAAHLGQQIFKSDRESRVREEDFTSLFERDAFAFQAAKRLSVLESQHEGLVFGRLDLADKEIRYVGRIGVRNEEYEPLVIDWRARAAEPFYRATPSRPMSVARRRVLRTRNDKVIGIEDDLLDAAAGKDLSVIGEGALMAALSRSRGHQMHDIVATIQAEQDKAIRADYRGVTIISGGPGTGKTVVALHRIAYLLYSHRRRFERGGILVVGPSALFLNYIERVLPSLGEDSVTLRAIGQAGIDILGFDATRNDEADAADVKGSLRMVSLLKRLVELPLVDQTASVLRVSVKGTVLTLSATRLAEIRHDILRRYPSNIGKNHATERLLNELKAQVPESAELSEAKAEDLITSSASYRMFLRSWWPDLTPTSVLARLANPTIVAKVAAGILSESEQLALAASYTEEEWSVADIALLDEIAAQVGPVQPDEEEPETLIFLPTSSEVTELVTTADLYDEADKKEEEPDPIRTYAHILIDEAQDLSPMQWRMLRRRGPYASWTIVGDPAQSSWTDPDESRKVINQLVHSAPMREFKLTKNYRSPLEVFNLASQVIKAVFPRADLPHAVRSTGIMPKLLVMQKNGLAKSIADEVIDSAKSVEGTVSIIAPKGMHAEISSAIEASPGYQALADRLAILTPLESKGLEYDAAIIVSPDDIVAGTLAGVRLLYVCLTRPTKRLTTIDVETPGKWRSALKG